jgi:hypothetical protein
VKAEIQLDSRVRHRADTELAYAQVYTTYHTCWFGGLSEQIDKEIKE